MFENEGKVQEELITAKTGEMCKQKCILLECEWKCVPETLL